MREIIFQKPLAEEFPELRKDKQLSLKEYTRQWTKYKIANQRLDSSIGKNEKYQRENLKAYQREESI